MIKIVLLMNIILFSSVSCMTNNKNIAIHTENIILQTEEDTVTLPITRYDSSFVSVPESVVYRDGSIYIADIGTLKPKSTNEGFFISISSNNQAKKLFEGKLHTPKGFAFIDDDHILVVDQPHVKLLKLSTEQVLVQLEIEDAQYLNDLVLINSNVAIISDSRSEILRTIRIADDLQSLSSTTLEGVNIFGINGLTYDSMTSTLYFITTPKDTVGRLYHTTLYNDYTESSNTVVLEMPEYEFKLDADGVFFYKNKIFISDWGLEIANNGKVLVFDLLTKKIISYTEGSFTTAGDFDIKNDILYIPEPRNSRVSSIDLSSSTLW